MKRIVRLGLGLWCAIAAGAVAAQGSGDVYGPRDACAAPASLLQLTEALPKTHRKLVRGDPIKIVALGSSSTAGAGASAARYSYPSRLAVALAQRYPGASIQIVNRGINGEDAWENVARLDTDVLAAKPDLVIWQMGTNAILHDVDYDDFDRTVQGGLDRMREAGIDVMLMDLQYAPRVAEVPNHRLMLEHFESLGHRNGIPVFHRYAVMKHWAGAMRTSYVTMLSSDGLHMNDRSYGCLAERLADAIAAVPDRSLVQPVATNTGATAASPAPTR